MSKDLTNLRKWFSDLGLEIDEKLDNDVLKKLIPPQRRDMWRNIMKYVLPKEQVELIKKSIVLHKLQIHQKPLMAKVESDEDLENALKYEKLMLKYNEIKKEIIEAKKKNDILKLNLNQKNEMKNKIINNIRNQQCIIYLSKHKIDYYNKCNKVLNDKSNICDFFSPEVNENLSQTDFENALIVCFTEVDNSKTSGMMNQDVNVGKPLCNTIYKTIKDISPANLVLTIECNIIDHINKSKDFLTETKLIVQKSDNEAIESRFNELESKLIRKQLDLKCKLSNTLKEKERIIKHFGEKVILVKNEIISQYQLKYIFCNDNDLKIFNEKLNNAIHSITQKSIDSTIRIDLEDNSEKEIFKINDDVLGKITLLHENIDEKQTIVQEMLNEVIGKTEGFGLVELKSVYENTVEDYSKKLENFPIDKKLASIKYASYIDIMNTLKPTFKSIPKSNVHFHTLQDITKYSEVIDVVSKLKTKFNQFIVTSDGHNFNEIKQKENIHKMEFDRVATQIENTLLELNSNIENCKIISETSKSLKHVV